MPRRFFVDTPISGSHAEISGAEANHIANVIRLGPGDIVILFDGSGCEFDAEIVRASRNQVSLQITGTRDVSREPAIELSLAVALPKGDRQKWLVEKLVELGVSQLVPIQCERSVAVASQKSVDRMTRYAIESSKQCGRTRLMQIPQAIDFQQLLELDEPVRLIALPGESVTGISEIEQLVQSAKQATIAVGPEGGFTDHESASALEAGWQKFTVAKTVLRVETAAVAVASIVAFLGNGSIE